MSARKPRTGQLGEKLLDQFCSEQGIICTKPDEDAMGWDRMLEWLDEDEDGTWDKRGGRYQAFVQVKEVHSGKGRIQLNPRTFREIVLSEDPAFLLVVEVNGHRVGQVRLVHVWKDESNKVLARLRAKNTRSFKLATKQKGKVVADSSAFLQEMHRHVGHDLASYRTRKRDMLSRLGYSEAPYRFSLSFEETQIDEVVEFFVGLRPNVDVMGSPIVERRFGIERAVAWSDGENPESPISLSQLRIPGAKAAIKLVGKDIHGRAEAVNLTGVLISPHQIGMALPLKYMKARFVCPHLEIVTGLGSVSVTLKALPTEMSSCDLEVWSTVRLIVLGSTEVHLISKAGSLPVSSKPSLDQEDVNFFAALRDMCEVVKGVNLPSSFVLRTGLAFPQRHRLSLIAGFLRGSHRLEVADPEVRYEPGSQVGAAFAVAVELGEGTAVISGKAEAIVKLSGELASPHVTFDVRQFFEEGLTPEIEADVDSRMEAREAEIKEQGYLHTRLCSPPWR